MKKSKFNILFEQILNDLNSNLQNNKIYAWYVIIPNEKIVFGSDSKQECQEKAKENPIWRVTKATNLTYMGWDLLDPNMWLNNEEENAVQVSPEHNCPYCNEPIPPEADVCQKCAAQLNNQYDYKDNGSFKYRCGHFTGD